jgi:hypothetical protein
VKAIARLAWTFGKTTLPLANQLFHAATRYLLFHLGIAQLTPSYRHLLLMRPGWDEVSIAVILWGETFMTSPTRPLNSPQLQHIIFYWLCFW